MGYDDATGPFKGAQENVLMLLATVRDPFPRVVSEFSHLFHKVIKFVGSSENHFGWDYPIGMLKPFAKALLGWAFPKGNPRNESSPGTESDRVQIMNAALLELITHNETTHIINNRQTTYLAGHYFSGSISAKLEKAMQHLEKFAVVGVSDRMDVTVALTQHVSGHYKSGRGYAIPKTNTHSENSHALAWLKFGVDDVYDEVRQTIHELNEQDAKLVREVNKRLTQQLHHALCGDKFKREKVG
jgi:hypothetical protein